MIKIFGGTEIGFTEGPHLYKRNGWYYLLTAEGGTSYGHACTLARSRSLFGPYEVHPENPLLTSVKDRRKLTTLENEEKDPFPALHPGLQKAGHGSLCEGKGDEWILAHLCSRPLPGTTYCPLGRETALQKVVWKEDGWPYLLEGNNPKTSVVFSGPEIEAKRQHEFRDDFDRSKLNPHFQTLRIPPDALISLSERPGWLRIFGAESIASPFRQGLIGLRVRSFRFYGETCLEFAPENFQQMAGLLLRYDEQNQYYLRVSREEGRNLNTIGLLIFNDGEFTMAVQPEQILPGNRVFLAVTMEERNIQFSYSLDEKEWQPLGPVLDSAKLSDDHIDPMGFTGMFLALGCQDLGGLRSFADFDYFMYKELKDG